MALNIIEGIIRLLGFIVLFLYGINNFGDGVQKLIGEKIRFISEHKARRLFFTITTGGWIAALLQSNLLTFGIISSLVNTGLLQMLPALWLMMGASLGLTITPLLMAFNIHPYSFGVLVVGYFIYFFAKRHTWHYIGQIIFSLGLVYLSFFMLYETFLVVNQNHLLIGIIKNIFSNPWLGFLIGFVLTTLLRNSNLVIVLLQAMVGVCLILPNEFFLSGAIAVIIGANIGSTIINMIGGIEWTVAAKRANWLHFWFNLSTGLVWIIFLPFFTKTTIWLAGIGGDLVFWMGQEVFGWPLSFIQQIVNQQQLIYVWQLVIGHVLFNLSVSLFWLPLTLWLNRLKIAWFAETKKGRTAYGKKSFLDRRALQSPALALVLVLHEINEMAKLTQEMLKLAKGAFLKGQTNQFDHIERYEEIIDTYQERITAYLSALLAENTLTEGQSHQTANLLRVVGDIERVGDHATSIALLAVRRYQEELPFTDIALNEMELLFGKVIDIYQKAGKALNNNDTDLAKQLKSRAGNIEKLEEELCQNHIHRLNHGKCWPGSGVVYTEILNNLLRIAAHSQNIAMAILDESEA